MDPQSVRSAPTQSLLRRRRVNIHYFFFFRLHLSNPRLSIFPCTAGAGWASVRECARFPSYVLTDLISVASETGSYVPCFSVVVRGGNVDASFQKVRLHAH